MARPKSQEARTKTIAATIEVVIEHGVNGFTVDEVSRRSGVAKSTIYRHWPSGDDLLFDAINTVIEPEPEPDTGSLRGDLMTMVDHMMAVGSMAISSHRCMFVGLLNGSLHDEQLGRLLRRMAEYRREPIRTVVTRAQQRGEIDSTIDVDLAVDILSGPFFARVMIRGETFTRAECERWVEAMEAALAPRSLTSGL
jgi:AcrR family transcriptional regulator